MSRKLIIYGAGGHARVIADAASLLSNVTLQCFCDDNIQSDVLGNAPIMRYDSEMNAEWKLVIGIGNNDVRKIISQKVKHTFTTIIHPSAIIANDVIIEEGSVVLANAVIQTGAKIGKHVIVNAGACIDHDVIVEDFVHIYPNAYIGGQAIIKEGVTIQPCEVVQRCTTIDKR